MQESHQVLQPLEWEDSSLPLELETRNRISQKVIELGIKYYKDVIIDFQGSQDGEDITRCDVDGNFKYIMPLGSNKIS